VKHDHSHEAEHSHGEDAQNHSRDHEAEHVHGEDAHDHSHANESDPDTEYTWRIHHPFGGDADEIAVEVAPKSGLLPRWRFVTPGGYIGVTRWGIGAPNGGPIEPAVRSPVEGGPVQLVNGPEVQWMGGLDPLSSTKSAYLVFRGDPPHYVAFGQADEPDGPPGALEGVSFGDHDMHPPTDSHSK
jgi:hypothetical protein